MEGIATGLSSAASFAPSPEWEAFRDGFGTVAGFVRDGYLYAPDPVKTGISPLDVMTGGIRPGLTVLGGEPGAGKSALALQIAVNAALAGRAVLYVSLEMDYHQCIARALSCASTLDPGLTPFPWARLHGPARASRAKFEQGRREGRAAEVMEELAGGGDAVMAAAGFLVERMPGLAVCADGSAATVEGFAETAGRACGLGASLVVLDYLQLLRADGSSDYERTGAASRRLTNLATSSGVPFLVLSSLSREGAGRADLHSFRGSGQIEYDADLALMLTRSDQRPGEVFIKALKNRHGEASSEAYPLEFDGEHSRFSW